jgi:hypothetical protein
MSYDSYLLDIAQNQISSKQELETGECLFCGNKGVFGFDLHRIKNVTFEISGEDILHTDCIESFKLELNK